MSQIVEFYADQHVFITGGNGFIGKILVEKLLRSTNVATIYLLMRKKKGKDVSARLEEMLANEPFRKLAKERPDFKNHIKIVVGDNNGPNLLSAVDEQVLTTKVNVVFHVAATIRFHENIKVAYDTNVGMTKKIIDLCKLMINLKTFIYVSTAYSNCYLKSIDEVFYDGLDFDYNKIENILSEAEGAEKLTKKILEKWPNTYSFTKAVAELLIRDSTKNLPVGVFRPSIVISTYKEPVEGWTDSLGGPNILVATVASGFTRFFCCNIRYVVDLVPVDMAVSALIATAWDVHQLYKEGKYNTIPIYNYVSSVDNPITYDEFIKLNIMVHTERYPFKNCLWTPKMTITKKSLILNTLLDTVYHYIPALIIDIVSIVCLQKPSMISKYMKFNASRYHMEYFMAHEWSFNNTNVRKIWNKMNDKDKNVFPFDLTAMNWIPYLRNYYKGIRCYLFKEPWDNLEKARIKAKRLKIIHQFFIFIIYFLGATTIWTMLLKIIPFKYFKLDLLKRLFKRLVILG